MQVAYRCPNCGQFLMREFSADSQSELVQCDACEHWLSVSDQVSLEPEAEGSFAQESNGFLATDDQANVESSAPLTDSAELELTDSEPSGAQSAEPFDWGALVSKTPRTRAREKPFFRKVLPPVLGGLAAFPIATAIMWYGFGRDLGNVGPWVAQYVPWIVPEKIAGSRFSRLERNRTTVSPRETENSNSSRRQLPTINTQSGAADDDDATTIDKGTQRASAANGEQREEKKTVDDSVDASSLSRANTPSERGSFQEPNVEVPKIENRDIPTSADERAIDSVVTDTAKRSIELTAVAEDLTRLRTKLYNAEDKIPLLAEYFRGMCRLSELASTLKLPGEADQFQIVIDAAKELLKDNNTAPVIRFGANGEIPGVPASKVGDFVVAIVEVSNEDARVNDKAWNLLHVCRLQNKGIVVESLPGAWKGADQLPTTCLVFGKLLHSDLSEPSSNAMKISAHAIIPR